MDNSIKYLGAGIVGVILGILIAPWFNTYPMMGTRQASIITGQNIDRHFIEEMIPHHEGAISMAKLALERSKRQEILSLAQGIIEAQERENKDMRGWYADWFGGTPSYSSGMGGMMGHGSMGMSMMGMEGDLGQLRAAEDFDLEFISQMIPHHEMAIMMARMLAVSTDREEMKTLADNIITSQSSEIQMMRGWYDAWSK
ncbi:MAG: DUF305 domain-containing protein [Patescibacteria group bacterium]